jgi:ribosomal protein L12E/L44/L45/RPP1/RPP2
MRRRVIEAVLNEILGPHNKPKAAVHWVHKLMGRKKEEEEKEKKQEEEEKEEEGRRRRKRGGAEE